MRPKRLKQHLFLNHSITGKKSDKVANHYLNKYHKDCQEMNVVINFFEILGNKAKVSIEQKLLTGNEEQLKRKLMLNNRLKSIVKTVIFLGRNCLPFR